MTMLEAVAEALRSSESFLLRVKWVNDQYPAEYALHDMGGHDGWVLVDEPSSVLCGQPAKKWINLNNALEVEIEKT